jgi:hypothetical protein
MDALSNDCSGVTIISLQPALAVVAGYRLTVLKGANKDGAAQLARILMSTSCAG